MNLHQIVRGAINVVNPDITVTIKQSTGYTIDDDGTQIPSYAVFDGVPAQQQALATDELAQMEGLSLQANKCAVYLNGSWSGIVRADGTGGDLFIINGRTWLVAIQLENWGIPGTPDSWVKLALVEQVSN
jgi:hypothetical protein